MAHNSKCDLQATVENILQSDELNELMQLDVTDIQKDAFDYILDCTPPAFALWTSERVFVILNRKLWQSSPVLMNHSAEGKFHPVEASRETAENLRSLAQTRIFPRDLVRVLELISLVKYLEIKTLLKVCFEHFCVGSALHDSREQCIYSAGFPPDCQPSTVLRVWEVLCSSPMRSRSVSQQYFKCLRSYSCEPDFIQSAKDIMKQKYNDSVSTNQEGLPCGFNRTSVLTGLFNVGGYRKTAVIKSGCPISADIFGVHFKEQHQDTVCDYYLVYNAYVIYRDVYASVIYRNLRRDCQPAVLANNVMQFLQKGKHLFLLRKSWTLPGNQILKWTGDALAELVGQESVGEHIDFCLDNKILCYVNRSNDALCLYFLRDSLLLPCSRIEHGCVNLFVFYRKQLCVWGKHVNWVYSANGNRNNYSLFPEISCPVSECKVVNGRLYLQFDDGWYTFGERGFQKFCADYKLEAFAAINLNPYDDV